MTAALRLDGLRKIFGKNEVVKGISLEIRPGEIFGLLGPNGAGKSTTINMVTGVTRVSGGTASVFGFDTQKDFVETRRLTGVMHQEIVVDTFFHIDRALKLHSGYYGMPDDPEWRNLLIDRLDLRPHLAKSMNKLSGGMKRRFMVAKALIHKPRLLILDEPTAGVDVELRQNLWDFVRELNQKEGTTVLLTTHYLEEAEAICERVAIMNHGQVLAMDRTRDLLDRMEQKQVLLHLSERLTAVPAALAGFAASLQDGGATLVLPVTKERPTTWVLREIANLQLPVFEIETRGPNLQEAFLRITKGGKSVHA
jgi:ABC-2 type transport system ATP-binding protein